MTKFEWESQLKRNLYQLPAQELEKVFEYYDEIFQDKIESGMSETAIMAQFGNPYDVAEKILRETNLEAKQNETVKVYQPQALNDKDENISNDNILQEPQNVIINTPAQTENYQDAKVNNTQSANKKFSISRLIIALITLFFVSIFSIILFVPFIVGASMTLAGAAATILGIISIFQLGVVGVVQAGMALLCFGIGGIILIVGITIITRFSKTFFKVITEILGVNSKGKEAKYEKSN